MRLIIKPSLCDHAGSMMCERCATRIVEGEKTGYCVLEEIDDGKEVATIVTLDAEGEIAEEVSIADATELEAWLAERKISLLSD